MAQFLGLVQDGPMIATDRKTHWETVYSTKAETDVSWYQDEPGPSLELIGAVAPTEGGRIQGPLRHL